MKATEVQEIVQLVSNTELLEISSMSEVRSEHKACFGTSLRHTKGFLGSSVQLFSSKNEILVHSRKVL